MERIYHTWEKWECYPAGFYESKGPAWFGDDDGCQEMYRQLLMDTRLFRDILNKVITEWKHSCEHYLTNPNMNRIAWLGQAAAAYAFRIPSRYRGGYNLLTEEQQQVADQIALEALNTWLVANGGEPLAPEEAISRTEMNLY